MREQEGPESAQTDRSVEFTTSDRRVTSGLAARLLFLQRSVGNTAVAHMAAAVQREDDERPPGSFLPQRVRRNAAWSAANNNAYTAPATVVEQVNAAAVDRSALLLAASPGPPAPRLAALRRLGMRGTDADLQSTLRYLQGVRTLERSRLPAPPRPLALWAGRLARATNMALAPANVVGGLNDVAIGSAGTVDALERGQSGEAIQSGLDTAAAASNTFSAGVGTVGAAGWLAQGTAAGGTLTSAAAALGPASGEAGAAAIGYAVGQTFVLPLLERLGIVPTASGVSSANSERGRNARDAHTVDLPSVANRLTTRGARQLSDLIQSQDSVNDLYARYMLQAIREAITLALARSPQGVSALLSVYVGPVRDQNNLFANRYGVPSNWHTRYEFIVETSEGPTLNRLIDLAISQRRLRRGSR